MKAVERLQALARLRELRERKARVVLAEQARRCDELGLQIERVTQEHCLRMAALDTGEARDSAQLLGAIVDHSRVQRYQQRLAERIHLDQHHACRLHALSEERAQLRAQFDTLRQHRQQRQAQCEAMAELLAHETRNARRQAQWQAELESEDRPGAPPRG